MAAKWKVRLSGTGGQGVIKGAVILAQAALLDGSNATQSQVYGPESRGGATRAEVNISDKAILFPKVETPTIMLCMSPGAYTKYVNDLAPGGIMICDSAMGQCEYRPDVTTYCLPITEMARETLGNELSANVVALGVINGIEEMVSREAMIASLEMNFKAKIVPINIKAYDMGYEAGKKAKPDRTVQ